MQIAMLTLCLLVAAGCATSKPTKVEARPAPKSETQAAIERVVVLSIDGLRPQDCKLLPTLGKLSQTGAFAAEGATSVMPTVTYPAHTTMVTGVNPALHGITTNLASDPTPDRKNKAGWRWYREDIKVKPIYEIALDAGMKTVLLNWPVTVGARATALLPEYSRAGTAEDIKLIRQLSTPGLLEEVAKRHPSFMAGYTPPEVRDSATIDAALTLLDSVDPQLTFIHIWQTDSRQHEFGPDTPEAQTALLSADAEVARLLAALQLSPRWPHTVLLVVSDHGFARIHSLIAPMVHLGRVGLGDQVWIDVTGAFAYLYLQPTSAPDTERLARATLEELAKDEHNGIAAVLDREAIAAQGGDPLAFLALEARPGFAMARETTGDALLPATKKGVHGYLPTRPEMLATLLFYGPTIRASTLQGARLLDVAPTLASLLRLSLPSAQGTALPLQRLP